MAGANCVSLQSDPETLFPSILAAIEAASPGDTVLLGVGEYNEQIVMSKRVKVAASMEAADGQVCILSLALSCLAGWLPPELHPLVPPLCTATYLHVS